jgi:hypothetical protein
MIPIDISIIVATLGIGGTLIATYLGHHFNRKNLELQFSVNRQADFVERYVAVMNKIDGELRTFISSIYSLIIIWGGTIALKELDPKMKVEKDVNEALNNFMSSLMKIGELQQEVNQFVFLSTFYFKDNNVFIKIAEADELLGRLLDKELSKILMSYALTLSGKKNDKIVNEFKTLVKTNKTMGDYLRTVIDITNDYERKNYNLMFYLVNKKMPAKEILVQENKVNKKKPLLKRIHWVFDALMKLYIGIGGGLMVAVYNDILLWNPQILALLFIASGVSFAFLAYISQ